MAFPEHLEPATYWEKRCELLEESVRRIAMLVAAYSLPPAAHEALSSHFREWDELHEKLIAEHAEQPNDQGNGRL